MKKFLFLLTATLTLAACVNTSDRIAAELTKAGLDPSRAQCVGGSLERDLSIGQLRQLAAAARAYRSGDVTPGRLNGADLLRIGSEVRDPAVPIAVAKAAGRCA
ncbi:lipoprotein [Sphingomonas piscis]|uniref:Type IV secretion system putative lipoprotein virB7 n=1 Tax=Sphingomonas piscis TaxID=2714943 RepID=A0A6G7YPD9_9SPHN|nr:lipoprotein [Sphingomonas piscis]QIK78604.1 lipoprotein [Sphingomonas piscis]